VKRNPVLILVLCVCAVLQGVLHAFSIFPQWERDYSPGKGNVVQQLAPDQIFLSLFGFREFLAGILWVRADGFFDEGNYDAVLPIIRLCTLLDPKQIDVYATGMWHIGYNFTDEEQRSDRRYIPSALALGKEGAKNNPNTYEMFFETGWLWYHKVQDDFPKAVTWFEEAQRRNDIQPARRNLLVWAYQRAGEQQKSLNLLFSLYERAKERFDKNDAEYSNRQNRDTIEGNLDTMLVRMAQRGWFAQNTPEGKAGNWYATGAYDTKPPFDVGFSVKATVVEPKVIKLEGTWNVLPVGTRIKVILKDKDYPRGVPAGMDWDADNAVNLDPPKDITYMQDELYVRNRRFNKKVDMSRDPGMYPFTKQEYVLEFYYNPRIAPPHIQDKFGFDGSGMTDKNFLNTSIRQGERVIYASFPLTRDMIWRRGKWADKVPSIKTANYIETGKTSQTGQDDVLIDVPALRGK